MRTTQALITALLSALWVGTAVAETPKTRDIVITATYLQLPITPLARMHTVKLSVDGKEFLAVPMEPANGTVMGPADWFTPVNVAAYKGQTLRISVPDLAEGSHFLENIAQSEDRLYKSPNLYNEPTRPLSHFTGSHGWINDANGPIYFNGQYHLFFQYDPATWRGNIRYWGHAVSPDLVHWTELDSAIAPDADGSIWSGSSVFDKDNTSGFGTPDHPPLVAIYTRAGDPFTQCAAYSTDLGKTFTKYAKNPIVPNINADDRDPHVFWHEPTKKWVMVQWVPLEDANKKRRSALVFLTSPNLRDWTRVSDIDGYFECPDLMHFPPTNGSPDRWVLTCASGAYQVGSFDGTTFKPSTPILESTRAPAFYAAQSFADVPASDGRVLQIGWLRGDIPDSSFNQSLTVVQELGIADTPDGPRLTRNPAREVASLAKTSKSFAGKAFEPGEHFLTDLDSEAVQIELSFKPAANAAFDLVIRDIPVSYDAAKQELTVVGNHTHAPLVNGVQHLKILLDRTSLEVFASDGQVYVPLVIISQKTQHSLNLFINNAAQTFDLFNVLTLGSMWRPVH